MVLKLDDSCPFSCCKVTKWCLVSIALLYLLSFMIPHTLLTSGSKSPCVDLERLDVLEAEVAEQRELIKTLVAKSQEVVVPVVSNVSVGTGLEKLSKKEELVLKWVELVKREIVLVTKLFDPGFKDKLDVTETKLVKELDDLVRGIKGEEGCLREGFVKGVVEAFEIEWSKNETETLQYNGFGDNALITVRGFLLLKGLKELRGACNEHKNWIYDLNEAGLVFINTHYEPACLLFGHSPSCYGICTLLEGVVYHNTIKTLLMSRVDNHSPVCYKGTLGHATGTIFVSPTKHRSNCLNTRYTLDTSFFKELC